MERLPTMNRGMRVRRLALFPILALCVAGPAAAACSIEDIERCTTMDPSAAERLLKADLEAEPNQEALFRIGRFYGFAPEVFRDLALAEWYLGRSARLGYQPAIDALADLGAPPVPPQVLEEDEKSPDLLGDLSPRIALADPPSYLGGTQLTVDELLDLAYAAGFRSDEQLLAAVAMGIAESALWTDARNWKPEQGFRPATDPVRVQGPEEVWKEGRQMHSDRGLWQISSRTWSRYPDEATDNPAAAAEITFIVSRRGTDFSLWDSFVSGRAQRHYDQAVGGWPALRPIVTAYLSEIEDGARADEVP